MARDYYSTLGVGRDATTEEIKRAFRRLARATHPDANPEDVSAEAKFREAAEAYEVLVDPERRRRYDRGDTVDLSDLLSGFGGFDDILRSVFGDGGLFGSSSSRSNRGRDVLVRVEVDLASAAFGADTSVAFHTRVTCVECGGTGAEPGSGQSTCPDCGGSGSVRMARRSLFGTMMTVGSCPTCRGEGVLIVEPCQLCSGAGSVPEDVTVTVEVPAGVASGSRLRLTGRGESGGRSGPPGDLYVEILVPPDPRFDRVDSDLIHRVTLGIAEATLGSRVEIPLLEGGLTSLDIPPSTQPGTTFRMAGLGVPRLGRRTRGDLQVLVEVRIPDQLSAEEESLLRRWSDLRGERTDRPASAG
ncbi:MAG: DnaJ domain-containing protein [Actinomycetota bacterium]|nr:DnaJ domain-containing protein [Actinomycetota bacterium]